MNIQTTDATTVKNQIIQQNKCIEQTGFVPILNIDSDIMNSWLKERLIVIPPVIGLEPTYFTQKSEKWLLLVKKYQKDHARIAID